MSANKPQKSASKGSSALERPESALEAALEDATRELSELKLELEDAYDQLEDTRARLDGTELELQNTQAALAAANRERVLALPENRQEVFAVLKFRNPQPLPVGGFCFFARQRRAVERTLEQFIAKNPDLDAVEVDELRLERTPRARNVYQYMKGDKNAPIEFSRNNFIVKEGHTEDKMKEYILRVFNTHTREE
ncbi:hypothetical protein EMPS_07561 [Entomortierella parvispora]|uniref:Uncharacterized protein n=1 Tax=Entomortierella parvispora TaxID=205924 RepID=A0A9P3LYK0_9FUNG|nr:hypothetical protein EMPS_07561 [Entomortierella parvispora]